MKPLPNNLLLKLIEAIHKYFMNFDIFTVPAPSFHTYEHYPIWWVAQQVSQSIGLNLEKLFPNKSGRKLKITFASAGIQIPEIDCQPGKFVLILDDIYTTGNTLRVACEAIAKKGSFPCPIAIA